jgi:hypothetical protein
MSDRVPLGPSPDALVSDLAELLSAHDATCRIQRDRGQYVVLIKARSGAVLTADVDLVAAIGRAMERYLAPEMRERVVEVRE